MPIENWARKVYWKFKFRYLLNKKLDVSVDRAEKCLRDNFHQKTPAFTQVNQIVEQYDVMIVIPVYNAERYLEQCIDSILGQKTEFTFQAIFVEDGSADRSREILRQRVRLPHIVIEQENKGVSAARNVALRRISGRYVMFLDSDDFLATNAIDKLVSTADACCADIVEAGHLFFAHQDKKCQVRHGEKMGEIASRELFGFPWGKVIRSNLLEDFCFPENYFFEDTVMSTLVHPLSRKTIAVPDILYYYRDNGMGITHRSKNLKEATDTFWIMKYCLEERLRRGQVLEHTDYIKYLLAARRNWIGTKELPMEIRQGIFVLTCELFDKNLKFSYKGSEQRMQMLELAIRQRSYLAFSYILELWDCL